jgi:hypothetical protein
MKTLLRSLLLLSIGLNSNVIFADEIESKAEGRKAVVILFNPPKGMEKEFLETFAKKQTSNLTTNTTTRKSGTESINLIPTKLGEPLIHIIIFSDMSLFEKTYKAFGPQKNRGPYVGTHSEKYGGLQIPKIYLQNSISYFADVP